MKLAITSLLAGTAAAFTSSSFNGAPLQNTVESSTNLKMETMDDLAILAKKLNPIVPRFDPLGLSEQNFWGTTQSETIGFLREAEIKHGRIAMFGFVGYLVHANGIKFPWAMQMDGTPFPDSRNPPELWDQISDSAKLQILGLVLFLEL